ncbi:branched-chain amino acid transport system ATP-binding protein [Halogranum gelatinilyticum]|uniref:Probable branched-chain amino acid transport ATP-binding protein LivG n=1 Tax=Halogranum gelatinilyticum TaxID=660521 RepID=A0A1G9VFF3_9EURY|nr:ABC transporter ATP-binding protein [Halogranum gelatinilyticum]SDM70791.1 branched-chain amino acid transport system ATP-binding protein [Halogranum gelatinilyticum]
MSQDSEMVYEGANLNKGDVVLRAEGLRKTFGGLVATDDASFAVERGSITGMVGPNGAGKSTLFNLVSGFYTPDAGSVYVNDTEVTAQDPHEVAREGLIRTFQTPRKLEGMTVREAMMVGATPQAGESILPLFLSPSKVTAEERQNLDKAEELLERFEIAHLIDEPSTDLSGGQLKLVELARAITTDPDVLLLDEPVAGVNPTLANDIKRFIRELNEEGQTFLIIEHDMPFIMDLADPIIVLDQGRVLMEGTPEQVRTDERVIDAYLGGADGGRPGAGGDE